jgi:signal transduction histidine kinase
LRPGESPLAKQLDALFGPHKPLVYSCITAKVSDHEYIVILEVNHHEMTNLVFESFPDADLQVVAEKLYLAHLKLYKDNHIADWEKAVHELASPLDFIYSNSDFLIHYLLSVEVSDDLRRKKLEDLRLVADLLLKRLHTYRFAFAGSNTLVTRLTEVNLYDTLMPITHLWYHESSRKGIRFEYNELRNHSIVTDRDALQFIAFNLISNAIKYSHHHRDIELYAEEDFAHKQVIFGVRNFGIPIAEEDVFKIFDLGYRSEAAKKADPRGLGVGLSVCKSLVQELGGSISCINNSGAPTVFEVQLPQRKKE